MNVNPFSYLIEKLKGKVDKSGDVMTGNLQVSYPNNTTSPVTSVLSLGNSIPSGTVGCTRGALFLYGSSQYRVALRSFTLTDNRAIELPDKDGTVALTSDVTGLIKSDEYYGTTNANGLIALPNTYDSRIILKAEQKLEAYETIHRVVLVGKYTTQNVFKVCNTVDLTPAANTNVTVKYYYI